MRKFHVSYQTDAVTGEDAEDAARKVWGMMQAPDSFPPVLKVVEHGSTAAVEVDLFHGTVVPAEGASPREAADAVRELKEQVVNAPGMPDALRLLAPVAGEDGLLEEVVFLLLAAREQVHPCVDFEDSMSAERVLFQALGAMADNLRDSLREMARLLSALGVMEQGNTADATSAGS
jgi:hypothetical protein